MAVRLGYLEEVGYAAEGNAVRHGDALHDMVIDEDESIRVLGMIGLCDTEVSQSGVLDGSAALARLAFEKDGRILMSSARYQAPNVEVFGLDPNLLDVKQAIRVKMYGYSVLSIVTLISGGDEW